MRRVPLSTHSRIELVDITSQVEKVVREEKMEEGVCVVYVPHTTAGVLINEGADPSVRRDIITTLEKIAPSSLSYEHLEGNAPAHIKASLVGSSVSIPVEGGKLCLGTWQSVYFCEFDGPRHRQVWIKIHKG